MSVEELIERPEKFPKNARVLIGCDEVNYALDPKQVFYVTDGKTEEVRIMQEEVIDL